MKFSGTITEKKMISALQSNSRIQKTDLFLAGQENIFLQVQKYLRVAVDRARLFILFTALALMSMVLIMQKRL